MIVTIDEKEYLRLGLLLQQTFPDARMQMVSVAINAKGTGRINEFRRVDEFVYFLRFGRGTIERIDIGDREVDPSEDADTASNGSAGLDGTPSDGAIWPRGAGPARAVRASSTRST